MRKLHGWIADFSIMEENGVIHPYEIYLEKEDITMAMMEACEIAKAHANGRKYVVTDINISDLFEDETSGSIREGGIYNAADPEDFE